METNFDINKAQYLGIEICSGIDKINDIIIKALNTITSLYPKVEDAKKIISSIENGEILEGWRYPKAHKKWHITTLFKKGKAFNKNHPAFTRFEKGKSLSVEIKGIVYIPGKIMFSIVFPDTPVENEFPHMTTLVGEYKPMHSNDVMKALFSKGGPLFKEYKNVFRDDLNEEKYIECVMVELFGKNEDCYVINFWEPVVLEAEMKAFLN
jgi:hypothetical protein